MNEIKYFKFYDISSRCQWPHCLLHGSAAARSLELWVRISPGAWVSVSCECCVLSGRGLCVGLITCPEEFYWVRRVWVWSWGLDKEETLKHQGILHHEKSIYIYTGCPRRNMPDFGRVFLMLNYTDITQNTYAQSWTVTEIMAREKCGLHWCRRTVRCPWRHTCPMRLPTTRQGNAVTLACALQRTVALTSQDNRSAAACVKYLEV